MDALTLLNVVLGVGNVTVAVFQVWKEWRTRHLGPHPLDDRLRDIASAIRNLKHETDAAS